MGKEILLFGDIEIEKNKFYWHKSLAPRRNVDTEKLLVSNKISFGEKNFKYFIGYFYNNDKVKPLYITLPKTTPYVKRYDGQIKWMYFSIEDDSLLEKYNTIWDSNFGKLFSGSNLKNVPLEETILKMCFLRE